MHLKRNTLLPAVALATMTMLGLLAADPVRAASVPFTATINSAQAGTDSTAFGSASLLLNDAMDRLTISIQIVGLDLGNQTPATEDNIVAMHIHRAPRGVNGPVVFGFISPNHDTNNDLVIDPVAGTIQSAWDLNEGGGTTLAAELPFLLNDGLYINVHTPRFPGGEIRGQIEAVPEPTSLGLAALGLAGIVGLGWRSRRRRKAG